MNNVFMNKSGSFKQEPAMPSGSSLRKPEEVLSRLKEHSEYGTSGKLLPELIAKDFDAMTDAKSAYKTRTSGFNRPIPVISKSTSTKKTLSNKFSQKILAPDPYQITTPADTEQSK